MRGIIFDFDGVVVDSEPLHQRAVLATVEPMGLGFPPEAFMERFAGLGDRACFSAIAAYHGCVLDNTELHLLRDRKIEAFCALVEADCPEPIPGVVDLIRDAAAAGPVGVCSGSRHAEVVPILRAIGVLDLLGTVVTADDVAVTKPDPEPYLLSAQRLGVEPARCAAVEDTPTGIASALSAGLRVAAVASTLPADRLTDATRVFPSINEINIADLLEL